MNELIAVSQRERQKAVYGLAGTWIIDVAVVFLAAQWLSVLWIASELGHSEYLARDLWVDMGALRWGFAVLPAIYVGAAIYRRAWSWFSPMGASAAAVLWALSLEGRVYSPFAFWQWRRALIGADAEDLAAMATGGVVLGAVCAAAYASVMAWKHRSVLKPVGTHGTGRFGSRQDLQRVGFTEGEEAPGVGVGSLDGKIVKNDGEWNVLIMGATGTGKSAAGFAPLIASHGGIGDEGGGMVVYDPKDGGELFHLTAGAVAARGRYVYRFDARDPREIRSKRSRINPFFEVPRSDGDVAGVQRLSEFFASPLRSEGSNKDSNWVTWARDIFECLVLHVLYAMPREDKNIGGVLKILASGPLKDVMKQMVVTEHDPGGKRGWKDLEGKPTKSHPHMAAVLLPMITLPAETLGGINANLMQLVRPFRDPLLREALSDSDFALEELYRGKSALYLTGNSSDSGRLAPVMQLILDNVMSGMERWVEQRKLAGSSLPKHRLLLAMDELPLLGSYANLERKLQTIRSARMRMVLGIQSMRQLRKYYGGEKELISTACALQVALGAEDMPTAKYLSELLGERSVPVANSSFSWRNGSSTSYTEVKRRLLTPDEVRSDLLGKAIVIAPNVRPALTDVRFWWREGEMPRIRQLIETSPKPDILPRLPSTMWDGASSEVLPLEAAKYQFSEQYPAYAEDDLAF